MWVSLAFAPAASSVCLNVIPCRLPRHVVVEDLFPRWLIGIGMAAIVLRGPLALTSTRWSIRTVGPCPARLHPLASTVAAAGALRSRLSVTRIGLVQWLQAGLLTLPPGWRLLRRRQVPNGKKPPSMAASDCRYGKGRALDAPGP
ncbi:hypothetical protein PZ897_02320 [Hoeflea sp. YIM 152468]|uniref:hypothetical protein n=1 Tax=Hoeflea sp. YIM 152468 TaxID=3031759 RepID=UPI0023DAF7F6|nr:hypothetical protein [Hoeflea sp. YIM 152468]MDF1607005.1 hypothetical protein [Hoeflea sp. YIM 152468]